MKQQWKKISNYDNDVYCKIMVLPHSYYIYTIVLGTLHTEDPQN